MVCPIFLYLFNIRAMSNRCWCWHRQTLRDSDFGSYQDSNHRPPPPLIPHQMETQFIASPLFHVSVSDIIPSPSAARPILVWKMPTLGHGDSDSSRISTSTRLPDASITRPNTALTVFEVPTLFLGLIIQHL